jgi:mitochondrial import inner membrane translocase subunit TIM50
MINRSPLIFVIHLIAIGIYKPQDVRPILQAYQGKDIPLEYAKKEAEAKQKHIEEWQHRKKSLSSTGFTLSSLFGSSSQV